MALDLNDLPQARTLLDFLRSEIRVRTYHLPLATYPAALQEAARLLDQKKTRATGTILLVALNTLVVIDQVSAIPLLGAKEAINGTNAAPRDKEAARNLLEIANHELERGMELATLRTIRITRGCAMRLRACASSLKGMKTPLLCSLDRLKEKLHRYPAASGETDAI